MTLVFDKSVFKVEENTSKKYLTFKISVQKGVVIL